MVAAVLIGIENLLVLRSRLLHHRARTPEMRRSQTKGKLDKAARERVDTKAAHVAWPRRGVITARTELGTARQKVEEGTMMHSIVVVAARGRTAAFGPTARDKSQSHVSRASLSRAYSCTRRASE